MTSFAERYGPWALVAGASDGTGEAFVRELAARGLNVVLVARRAEVLASVATSLPVDTRVVVADLTSPTLESEIAAECAGLEIGLLVYNAGAEPGVGPFLDRPMRDARFLVDLNCVGVVTLTHLLGRPMLERGRGGIVLMTSGAALAGAGYIATYAATKAFDLLFAEGLWQELQPRGIDVTAVVAGATDTPSMRAANPHFATRTDLADPRDVAVEALDWLGRGPWVGPGDMKAVVEMLRPGARAGLSNGITQATAEMYHLPFTAAAGEG